MIWGVVKIMPFCVKILLRLTSILVIKRIYKKVITTVINFPTSEESHHKEDTKKRQIRQ